MTLVIIKCIAAWRGEVACEISAHMLCCIAWAKGHCLGDRGWTVQNTFVFTPDIHILCYQKFSFPVARINCSRSGVRRRIGDLCRSTGTTESPVLEPALTGRGPCNLWWAFVKPIKYELVFVCDFSAFMSVQHCAFVNPSYTLTFRTIVEPPAWMRSISLMASVRWLRGRLW